jgi:hypothetical protein
MQHFTATESDKCKNGFYDFEYFLQNFVVTIMLYRFKNDEIMK